MQKLSDKLKGITLCLIAMLTVSGCSAGSPEYKIPVQTKVYTFSDGENVSTWMFKNDNKIIYCLENDIELLATDTVGPEHYICENAEPFDALSPEIQTYISSFYKQQGALYDVEEYLETAYAEYNRQEDKSQFRCYYLRQETFLSSSNEDTVFCTTTLRLPLNQEEYDEYSITSAFDRKTGTKINGWDLFLGSEERVKSVLLSNYTTDPEILAVLYDDFRPEYVSFYPDEYQIVFPAATTDRIKRKDFFPSSNIMVSGQYTEDVLTVLKARSIPSGVY